MKLLPFLLSVVAIFLASCGSDVECTVEDFNSKTQAQVNALNSAIDAYNMDNTDDLCNRVKDEANAYIDLLRDFQDCEELNGSDLTTGIQNTQDLLSQLPCN